MEPGKPSPGRSVRPPDVRNHRPPDSAPPSRRSTRSTCPTISRRCQSRRSSARASRAAAFDSPPSANANCASSLATARASCRLWASSSHNPATSSVPWLAAAPSSRNASRADRRTRTRRDPTRTDASSRLSIHYVDSRVIPTQDGNVANGLAIGVHGVGIIRGSRRPNEAAVRRERAPWIGDERGAVQRRQLRPALVFPRVCVACGALPPWPLPVRQRSRLAAARASTSWLVCGAGGSVAPRRGREPLPIVGASSNLLIGMRLLVVVRGVTGPVALPVRLGRAEVLPGWLSVSLSSRLHVAGPRVSRSAQAQLADWLTRDRSKPAVRCPVFGLVQLVRGVWPNSRIEPTAPAAMRLSASNQPGGRRTASWSG
jgi:hypothetical protein